MSQQHSNTKKRSFQHLTPYQRGQIQALIEQRIPKVHIAKQVGIARSTLYEELKRGTVDQMRSDLTYYRRYFADTGQLVRGFPQTFQIIDSRIFSSISWKRSVAKQIFS